MNVPSPQRGQALTEFLVIALVLIPLFLVLPLIAKYQDIAHATQMASRYLAFDAMVRNEAMATTRPADQLAMDVRRRFFSNSTAPIKSGDAAGDFVAHQNMFWRDPRNGPLIKESARDITISFGRNDGSSPADAYQPIGEGKPFNSPVDVAKWLGLKSPGVYTAKVTVALTNIESAQGSYTQSYDAFRKIGLTMTRHTSLLVDPWMAEHEAATIKRIDDARLIPTQLMKEIYARDVVDVAVGAVELPKYFYEAPCVVGCGPKLADLEFWKDVVPKDRLK